MKKVSAEWVRRNFWRKPIVVAPQSRVETFSKEIGHILDALGHPEAFVTDESKFSDFCIDDTEAQEISSKLKIKISDNDYLVNVAEQLSKRK